MVSFGAPHVIAGTANQDAEPPQVTKSGSNVFIVWHEFPTPTSTQPDVFFSKSTNKGASFSGRMNLSNSGATDSSGEDIAVSQNRVFIVWSENADVVLFRRSANNGASFEPVKQLSVAPGATRPQIVASGSNVYVVWDAMGQGGHTDIFFVHSGDNGHNFSKEVNISNNNGVSEAAQIAVPEDRIVVTWRDDSVAGQAFEVFFAQGK